MVLIDHFPENAGGEYLLGVDEAGRGPALGPMVYCAAFVPAARAEDLRALGVDDSKKLTEEQRDGFFKTLKDCGYVGWSIHPLSPRVISGSMLRRVKYNLNALAHDTTIGLIRRVLARGVNVTEIYVDTVGPPEKYEQKLSALFPGIKVRVEKKADAKYPIVSAASICAKVTRDEQLSGWEFVEEGLSPSRDYGSGYPSDPACKKWLREVCEPIFGFPSLVRFSWSTCDLILDDMGVAVDWPEEDDEDGGDEHSGASHASWRKSPSAGTQKSAKTPDKSTPRGQTMLSFGGAAPARAETEPSPPPAKKQRVVSYLQRRALRTLSSW